MDARKMYAGKYLSAADIGDKPFVTKILACGMEAMQQRGQAPRRKITLDLDGQDKPLVVGKINADKLILELGPDTDKWLGATVTLRVVEMMIVDKLQDVIVIKSAVKPSVNGQAAQ